MSGKADAPLVVVGDAILDIDAVGRAERLCPDAPVPVLDDLAERPRPGGAALAASLSAAGGERPVVLVTPLADDADAARLCEVLDGRVELVALPWAGSTPVKTRLRADGQTVARLDRGGAPGQVGPLPARARSVLADAAAVLVCDYGVGCTAAPQLREALSGAARRAPLVWDPHPRGQLPITGAQLATPNAREAAAFVPEVDGSGYSADRRRAELLVQRWGVHSVAVTRGADGALLSFGNGDSLAVPCSSPAAGDACGAGDCFAAAVADALADGAVLSEAVVAGVRTAERFVAAGGAAGVIDAADALATDAAADRPGDAPAVLAAVRRHGGRVVATGGCFDLIHAGHIATLRAARALGDCLIVCLNSDASVRRLKGEPRPLQPAADRARVLAALRCVDAVTIFDEDTPVRVLRDIRPDIWVKGGDYDGAWLPEAEVLREWGGEVVTVPYLSGRSTSGLVRLARR